MSLVDSERPAATGPVRSTSVGLSGDGRSLGDLGVLWVPAVVLVLALLVTGSLAWVSYHQYTRNERRLLGLRLRDAGALLTAALPDIQSELASAAESAFFARATASAKLGVIGLLRPPGLRLGYAFATPGVTDGFVAYGENQLPADRRSAIERTSAFTGLDYALYLGSDQRFQDLLLTSQARLPLPGPTDSVTVPFGTARSLW